MKVLGVLGGMGPAATLDFLAKLQAATPAEREALAKAVSTSVQYLSHVAVNEDKAYKREPKIPLAAGIERETSRMAKQSKGRLPIVLRTDMIEGCRACPYAQKVLGERFVVAVERLIGRGRSSCRQVGRKVYRAPACNCAVRCQVLA